MGCDIHIAIEKRAQQGSRRWKMISSEDACYRVKNYELFEVLGGIGWLEGIQPISEPRGLPSDVSASTRQLVRDGDHSVSWLTVGEVRAYDWNATFLQRGNLNALGAARLFRDLDPREWSIETPPGRRVDLAEMKRLLATQADAFADAEELSHAAYPELSNLYVTAEWPRSLRSACSDFLGWLDTQDLVCRWRADDFPNDVRLVFSFDS